MELLIAILIVSTTPHFKEMKPISPIRGGANKSLVDINTHIPVHNIYESEDDLGHERTHGINSLLRQRHPGNAAFYVLENRYIVLKNTRFRKTHVAGFIGNDYLKNNTLFPLYVLDRDWDDTPSHLIDEWVAYTNGSTVRLDYARSRNWPYSNSRRETISNMLLFNFYVTAFVQAVDRYDPSYVDKEQLHEFIYWNIKRTFAIYKESLSYPELRDKTSDFYYTEFIRRFVNETKTDGESVQPVLSRQTNP